MMTFLPFVLALLVLGLRSLGTSARAGSRYIANIAVGAALLLCACFARYSLATVYIASAIVFLVPLIDRVRPLSYAAAIAIFALWPWSGIIARALPIARNYAPPVGEVQAVSRTLAAGEALPIAVPLHARDVIVTTYGGYLERLRSGHVIGAIEATDRRGHVTVRPIRIGGSADFGFMRREQFFASRNPLPRFSPGEIRDYGANAWVWGAGRTTVSCASGIVSLRVVAAADLHAQSRLVVGSVEYPRR